jgi:Flp pilus assembly protein TadG
MEAVKMTARLDRTKRFGADRRGNMGVAFAAVSSVLLLSAGFALNTGQLFLVKSNLSNALDAAVTSTARELTTGKIPIADAKERVETFLKANGARGFAQEERVVLDSVVVDTVAKTVEAKASVLVDVAFPLFGTSDQQRVSSLSAAAYSDKKIEVAMMLDITGSMAGQKIKDLKVAADIAVDAFLAGESPENPRIRLAIVPYASAVNTGPLAHTVFVEARGSSGKDDIAPGLDKPLSVGTAPDSCATERKDASGKQDFSDASPSKARVNRDDRLTACPAPGLVPLTADADKLHDLIDSFRDGGVTAGHIGIQWTRYLLSPNWKSVLEDAAKGSGPAEYNDRKTAKIAILMTDGEFNTAYAGVPRRERTEVYQAPRSQAAAEELCRRMKTDGIQVFTIGFMLTEAGAKRTLANCASPDTSSIRHHYQVATGAELTAAFKEIAANTERLLITR